jgi:nucleotide-binding universal stress UspA family protein
MTVVVGYDGHDAAERALDRAIAEAAAAKTDLVVVAVVEMPLNPEGPQNFGTLDDSPAAMIPLVTPPEIEFLFDRARDRIEAAGVEADFVWSAGEPARELVAVARDRDASLLVVGHHHHSLLGRLFDEDVAAAVRREAHTEVVTVD